jgi:hypothetical protein
MRREIWNCLIGKPTLQVSWNAYDSHIRSLTAAPNQDAKQYIKASLRDSFRNEICEVERCQHLFVFH